MTRKDLEAELLNAKRKIRELEQIIDENLIGNSYKRLEVKKLIEKIYILNEQIELLKAELQLLKEKFQKKETKRKNTASSLRHTKEYKEFRLKILARDGNKCTKCGSEKKLQVHHKKSVGKYPELALNENNVITLCAKCHTETDNYLSNT